MSFASMTSSLPFIKAGRLRPLAVSSKHRSAQLPDVPTMGEAGVPGLEVRDWQGILGPRGVPRPIVDKLNTAARAHTPRAGKSGPPCRDGSRSYRERSPQEFAAATASEIKRWASVVKQANIKVEG